MRVTKAPKIEFKCSSCGATCEGDASEFAPQNTMPPTWTATCAFCHHIETCSPTPLIAKAASADARFLFDFYWGCDYHE